MKFKLGPFDFQWLNICASNSRAALQLKGILECQSHSTGTPHCSVFLGEFFFPGEHLQGPLPRMQTTCIIIANRLIGEHNLMEQMPGPPSPGFLAPDSHVFKNHTERGEGIKEQGMLNSWAFSSPIK